MTRLSTLKNSLLAASVGLALALPAVSASAHPAADKPEQPRLQLSAEASTSIATDELTVRLAYEKDGPTASALNADVLRTLTDALAQAKKVAGVEARLSSVHTNPNWDGAGKRKGWKVRGEIVLRGKNIAGLSELSGKLSETLQLAGVDYGVSEELAAETRKALIADAARAFKDKAQASVSALGFSGYDIADVSLGDGIQASPPIAYKARGAVMSMQADSASLPTEGGTQRLSVTFSGSVLLKR
jgi:predicted secreted protein